MMNKILYIIFVFSMIGNSVKAQQKLCCPKFELYPDFMPCKDTLGKENGGYTTQPPVDQVEKECDLTACKHTKHAYYVFPAKSGYIYTWVVSGGVALSTSGNPVMITWGNGIEGRIKIFIRSADNSCKDTIDKRICLQNAPTAAFNFSPASPVCLNNLVQFTNTSVGATNSYWDFGDGTSSSQINPSHTFTHPGTYTIILAVNNGKIKPINNNGNPIYEKPEMECGCRDTIRRTIVVKNESPLQIKSGCKKMLCSGDTATYCTPNNCNSYVWSVTGGRISGSANGKCIIVIWDGNYPATVTLNSNCGGSCGNTATINVPVLYPTMPITGNQIVCPGSLNGYSLPGMPGTFYKWTVTGGGNMITSANKNTAAINILWGSATGSYTITCNYNNPASKCSGTATTTVQVLPPYKINGPQQYCIGDNFTFSANGSSNWSIMPATGFTPASFPAGTSINGVWNKPGTYTVSATPTVPSNFCSYPDSKIIIVNDTPKLNKITGELLICPGGSGMYQISSNMNAGSFFWQVTGGMVISYMGSHSDSVMVTWNATGPYEVKVRQQVNGCFSSYQSLLVHPHTPPLISGTFTTCMDNALTYTASGTAPAGGFIWTLNNGLGTIVSPQGLNTIQILWHGSATANDSCKITVTTCAGTDTKTIKVTKPQPISITKTGSLCSTNGITLTASVSGAGTYVWKFVSPITGITTTLPQTSQTITVTQAGLYTVTINSNHCQSVAEIEVADEKLNITANLSTQDKTYWKCLETVNTLLHAIPGTGYCYQWYKLAGVGYPISGATSSNYTAVNPGYYFCQISVCGTSCIKYTDTIRITKEPCPSNGTCIPSQIDFSVSSCNPLTFTASVTPAAGLGSIEWHFGDGKEENSVTPTHNYRDTGNYLVCVRSWSANGYCYADTCKAVHVTIAVNFAASVSCDKVTFTNLSKSTSSASSYNWSFPGGSPASSNLATPPVITYATAGIHLVTLSVSDGTCISVLTDTVNTRTASATMNIPSPICAQTDAPFTATSSNPSLHYNWIFGDGFISNSQNTSHAYQLPGAYTVTLTVNDGQGCIKTYTQPVNVSAAIAANIGADKFICPGGSVLLTAPTGFTSYQWYHNGLAISSASSALYTANTIGEYWVKVSNGDGCAAMSNHVHVLYSSMPVADIIDEDKIHCTGNGPIKLQNSVSETGWLYNWVGSGPGGFTSSNSGSSVTVNATVSGEYSFILTVTNAAGCKANDTICVTLNQSPSLTVTNPIGPLCEGKAYTFTATASPNISPSNYLYQWSNTFVGNPLVAGNPGSYTAYVANPEGCTASAMAATINPRPDISLFPVGCDTLCWTDTLFFPLPSPAPFPYTISWFDDDGTAITNVGSSFSLPLSNLQPGIHHLYSVVSFPGGCADTTGKFDLYIKDCTLLPPCDNCTGFFESAEIDMGKNITQSAGYQTSYQNINITILKQVKEVRLSLSDLQYHWEDSTCINCKVKIMEQGCMEAIPASNSLGTLLLDNTASGAGSNCKNELVWKGGTPLQPGTYTISIQLKLPDNAKPNCRLIIDKLCYHLTLIDTICKQCIKPVCYTPGTGIDKCKCNTVNYWTSLYLVPTQPGIPKPQNQILCNSVLTDIKINTPYLLSGVYHCQGTGCIASKNEINVYNQVNDITYTRVMAGLHETISFNTPGYHTVQLIAWCGTQKCICSFRVYIEEHGHGDTTHTDTIPPIKSKIDSVLTEILPPDFNGEILVSKNDSVLYEKYISYKDSVNSHSAFDLASITKTFTSMGILKLMENGKLSLDDAVNKYLPQFPVPEITIRMLLTHTSGLEDYLKFMEESDWDKSKMMSNAYMLNFISNNRSKVLINTPGKVFDYSNTNFALLSLIITKISGMPYSEYMAATFFKPLKMEDTYVLSSQNAGLAKKSYYKNGKMYINRYLDFINGDKGIYSTVQDLRKWDKGLRTMFKSSTINLAYSSNGYMPAMTSVYALGWRTIKTASGLDIWYHMGWWAGNRSIFIRLPKGNVMITAMSNNNHTTVAEIRRLCDLFGDYGMSNNKISNF